MVGFSQDRDVSNQPDYPTFIYAQTTPGDVTATLRAVVRCSAMSVKAVAMPNDDAEGAPRRGILRRGSVIGGRVRIGGRDDVVSGDANLRRRTAW